MSRQIDDLRNAMLQQSTTVGADLAQALLPVRAELVTGRARTDQLATMQAEQGQAQAKILEGWEQVARSVQADAEKLEQLSRHSAASLQEIATALAAFRAEHRREEPAGPTALTQTLDELRAGLRACREETASLSAVAERHRADTLRGFALLLQAHRLPELEELAARRRDLEARLHSLSLEEANRKQRSPDLFDAFKDARRREALKRAQQESDDVDRQYRSRVLPWELTMRRLSEMAAGVRQE